MIHFAVTRGKRRLIDDYLEDWGRRLSSRLRVVEYDEIARARSVPRGTWVLADLDTLGPAGTALAATLHEALVAAGLRVLNHPRRTLGRLELIQALHEAGINDFRAVRASDDRGGLRYPVFLRSASDHFGAAGGLLDTPEAVDQALERADRAGLDIEDLILVEYEDTSRDGIFQKHAAYAVGDRVMAQHAIWSRHWMIKHRKGIFDMEVAEEELRIVRDNPHEETLREVFRIAAVDYGRADYGVGPDGRIQVWEINLCPKIGRRRDGRPSRAPAETQPIRTRRKEIFYARFADAWEAVDDQGPEDPPVELRADDALRERALEELAVGRGWDPLKLLRAKWLFRES